jgi:hypothetical protein
MLEGKCAERTRAHQRLRRKAYQDQIACGCAGGMARSRYDQWHTPQAYPPPSFPISKADSAAENIAANIAEAGASPRPADPASITKGLRANAQSFFIDLKIQGAIHGEDASPASRPVHSDCRCGSHHT